MSFIASLAVLCTWCFWTNILYDDDSGSLKIAAAAACAADNDGKDVGEYGT